jgi:hypothetical protein
MKKLAKERKYLIKRIEDSEKRLYMLKGTVGRAKMDEKLEVMATVSREGVAKKKNIMMREGNEMAKPQHTNRSNVSDNFFPHASPSAIFPKIRQQHRRTIYSMKKLSIR